MSDDDFWLFISFLWKALSLSFGLSLECDLTWAPRTFGSLQGLQREALCSMLISCPVRSSFIPLLISVVLHAPPPTKITRELHSPPLSCRLVAMSRLSVLTMEKSASTTTGKWSQRKPGQKIAIKLTISSIIQQKHRVAHPVFPGYAIL